MNASTEQPGGWTVASRHGRSNTLLPEKLAEVCRGHYRLRLARDRAEVRAAQVLRFVVFNLELQEGFEQSYSTCLDADAYDAVCDHLVVDDLRTGEVVGTYRLHTGLSAAANLGYYSAQEFDFSPYEPLRSQMIELGRACVHSNHRNLIVLGLLWKGIANYATAYGCRYLTGCSSLTSQDQAVGWAAYRELQRHLVKPEWRTSPRPAFACSDSEPRSEAPKIPKLLTAYLSLGAKICGPPAIDREFKTIDFLTFLDISSLSARMVSRYLC